MSELSAADQPWAWIFSGGDLVSGVLTIGLSLIVLSGGSRSGGGSRCGGGHRCGGGRRSGRGRRRSRDWATFGWTALLLFGVSAIGDAVFTMDCAPSADTTCALRERSGSVSFSHQFHDVTSGLVVALGIAALGCLSVAARRDRDRRHPVLDRRRPALARWGALLAIAEAVTAVATLVLMYVGAWLGFVQRVQITILSLGLLLIAWEVRVRPVHPSPPPAPSPHPPLVGSGHR